MALFGEKYGDRGARRSRSATGRASCAAAPTRGRSGQLGVIKLLGESSIGSGVRRVEALVGGDAYRFLAREHVLVAQLSEALKARPERAARAGQRHRRAAARGGEGDREGPRRPAAGRRRRSSRPAPRTSRGVNVVAHRADGAAGGDVRTLALDVRGRLPAGQPGVVVIIGVQPTARSSVVAAVNDEARARGVSANALVRAIGPLVGGKGGGKDDVAQGGGADASRIDEALALVPRPRSPAQAGA